MMRSRMLRWLSPGLVATALACGVASTALAQSTQQAAAAAPPPPLAIPAPTYTTLRLETTVDRPAAQVWARVGKFCDIGEWLKTDCTLAGGRGGELGAVRRLRGGAVIEMLVGRTDLSYTYTQPVRVGVPFNAYHGTLEAKPVGPNRTLLIYSFFYDNSMLADAAARDAELANRRSRFGAGLTEMKRLAEAR